MFKRALYDHESSQKIKQPQITPVIQRTIDFSGSGKRKALDTNDDSYRAQVVKQVKQNHGSGSGLIAALSGMDSFVETQGQVLLDGEVFDEADFDDMDIDGWESPPKAKPLPPTTVKVKTEIQSGMVRKEIVEEDDYFKDVSDLDWDITEITPTEPETVSITQTAQKSSPPEMAPLPAIQPGVAVTEIAMSIKTETIQNKENLTPPIMPVLIAEPQPEPEPQPQPAAQDPQDLGKVLFPSSAPLPWSSSPVALRKPVKRTLPWLAKPNRYGPPAADATSQYRKEKQTQIKSIVREGSGDGARSISTMAMEAGPRVDWDVLGLNEKDIFARKKQERADELRVKQEEAKRGMEWIDQAPAAATAATRRRKLKTEDTAVKQKNNLVGDRKPLAKVFLSQEQLSVRKIVVDDKRSVFFTGSAGTGKSVLLREIISALKTAHARNPEAVAVTASTGLAACNVGGITLHSFAAFGLGRESVEELIKKVKRNKKGFERWRRTKVLIIDEISMVDAVLFDKLEALARALRKNELPFGGIQLVITGDFFQLPPVPEGGREAKFTFEAETWTKCIPHTIKLTSVFRQKDQEFVTMLNEMRLGMLSQDSIFKFKALQRIPKYDDNLEPTELFPKREEVEYANNARMRALPGSIHSFTAEEGGAITGPQREKLLSNCMAPQVLELKKDAQVMLIKNMDENLVNGSLGKVIGFMSETTYSLCEREGIDVDAALNFDAKAGGDDPFGFATLDGEDSDSESVLRKKRRILKMRALSAETSQLWPLVRFTTATGLHVDRLVTREKWSFELPDGEVQAYRKQIPLILAYAISIHKAQGQTLSRVRVDLGNVFEKGQAYVALSRATSREGLQVLRFDARKVMAHPKVAAFYRSLENIEHVVKKEAESKKGWDTKALDELLDRDEEEYGLSSYAYG